MIELFKIIIVTSIWVLGLTIASQPDMVLYFLRDRMTDENGKAIKAIYEPLFVCHWCMPSIHSVIGISFSIVLGFTHFGWHIFFLYPLVVMGSSIAVGLIWQLYSLLSITTKHFTHTEQIAYFEVKRQKQDYQNKNKNNGNTQKKRFSETY